MIVDGLIDIVDPPARVRSGRAVGCATMPSLDFGRVSATSATATPPRRPPRCPASPPTWVAPPDRLPCRLRADGARAAPRPPRPRGDPHPEEVTTTMAGRAFTDGRVVAVERETGARVWAPMVEGSDRTGVLALTVESGDDETLGLCADLGALAGFLIAAYGRTTDIYNLHRRRKSMSLGASMQWDLLPPWCCVPTACRSPGSSSRPTRWLGTASTTRSTARPSTSPSSTPWGTVSGPP